MALLGYILLILAIIFVFRSIIIVKQAQVLIIERLGKYNRSLYGGIHLIIPIFEKPRTINWRYVIRDFAGNQRVIDKVTKYIDLRETVYDFPKQNVITKDNVSIEINGILYFQITDPMKAVYEIYNLPDAIEKLTQTTLRNIIGELDLDQTLTSRDVINNRLRIILDEATDKWGVKINRVEILDITPPEDVRTAMEKQMKAERERRAKILVADGEKQSKILEAEGKKEAEIAVAQGLKQARILVAEGESQAIKMVADAIREKPESVSYLVALKYIDAIDSIGKNPESKTVFLPYEATSLLSSLGAMKELLKNIEDKAKKVETKL